MENDLPALLSFWDHHDQAVDAKGLAKCVFDSFVILEPWYLMEKSSQHNAVIQIRDEIVGCANLYIESVDQSLEVARNGITLAETATALCKNFLDGQNSTEKLEVMAFLAGKGHKECLSMNENFRAVRRGLMEIAKNIPTYVTGIQQGSGNTGARLLIKLLSRLTRDQWKSNRDLVVVSPDEVIKQLKEASEDLARLCNLVGTCVDWWCDMKAHLESLKTRIPHIAPDNSLRTQSVTTKWEDVKYSYVCYTAEISLIQDYYTDLKSEFTQTLPISIGVQQAENPETDQNTSILVKKPWWKFKFNPNSP